MAMRFLSSFVVVLLLFIPIQGHANASEKDLKKVEQDLSKTKSAQKSLAQKKQQLEKELATLQSTLSNQAKTIQKYENEALTLQDRLSQLRFEMDSLRSDFKQKQQNTSDIILAARRLSRVPPQASILRPEEPIDIARSELLISSILPMLQKQITSLKDDLLRMATLQKDLKKRQAEIKEIQTALKDERTLLALKLAKRKQLMSKTTKNYDQQQKKIAALTKKSKSLQSLIKELSKKALPVPSAKPSLWGKVPFVSRGKQRFSMPVAGRIVSDYNRKKNQSGWSIASAPEALVTAPAQGRVKFAGPFRNYKLLVIIEHGNGLLSLVGNMNELYVETGYTLQSGEPIGKLGGDSSTQLRLYYELRKNGTPINPAKYIKQG